MSDLIYRQAAIEAVEKYDFDYPQYMGRFVTELLDATKKDLINDLSALPSAEPVLYGYNIDYLAMIAYTMKQNNVSPQEANEILKNTKCVIQMMHNEQEKILKRILDDIVQMPLPEPYKEREDKDEQLD